MFKTVLEDIEGVFASAAWTTNNIKTFPLNYQGDINATSREYILVGVFPTLSNHADYQRSKKLEGIVTIKVFVPSGRGQGRLMEVSDLLDAVLESKLIGTTRLGTSYLNVEGLDPDNKSLYSGSYTIPFTSYGE